MVGAALVISLGVRDGVWDRPRETVVLEPASRRLLPFGFGRQTKAHHIVVAGPVGQIIAGWITVHLVQVIAVRSSPVPCYINARMIRMGRANDKLTICKMDHRVI